MKIKKLLLTGLASIAVASGLTACGDDTIKIGILRPVEHAALNAARDGFKAAVEEIIGKGKVTFQDMNAAGNDADLNAFATTLVDKCDLTFGLGTGAAQFLKAASISTGSSKPVLFSAVTDPIDAKLLSNKDAPEGFVTGTSDMNPVEDQIALLKEIIPSMKKIGILYTQTETNSVVQGNLAKAKADELGLTAITKTCTNSADITSTAQSLVNDGVEAIYIPTDNNVASNMNAVKSAVTSNHILVMCGEEGMISTGGHVSLSLDYTNLGREAGIMAANILLGKKTVAESPVKYMSSTECKYVYSSRNIADCGITLSDTVLAAHNWVDVNA